MKHVIVTGAAGFVGQALAARLLDDPSLETLTVADRRLDPEAVPWLRDDRVRAVEGDLTDPRVLGALMARPVDQLYHLASVAGALAEQNPELGLAVNLHACVALLHGLARRRAGEPPPRVVFASSIAVYGALAPDIVLDEETPCRPALSYGTHKRMVELLLADLTRRGEIDGLSLRLPGIVARPAAPTGHGSAFMSDLIRRGLAGEPYECPVTPSARCWWMSLPACLDNLIHAASIEPHRLPAHRAIQLPVLVATVGEVAEAIARRVPAVRARLTWKPDERTEQLFGRLPALATPQARALGFTDDGDLERLVSRAARPH